jgi:hypothetical protein
VVKELRLKGVTTIEGANKLLRNGFVEDLNRKFARSPQSQVDFHRPVNKGRPLCEILCFEKTATVTNDWVVRCENRFYQILKRNDPLPRPRQKVTVRRLLDGEIQLIYRDKKLNFTEIEPPEAPLRYTEPATPPFIYCMVYFFATGADYLLHTKRRTLAAFTTLMVLDQFKMGPGAMDVSIEKYTGFLARQPGDFVVVDAPLAGGPSLTSIALNQRYMFRQTLHEKKIWAGFVARNVQTHCAADRRDFRFGDNILSYLHEHPGAARYVVIHHKLSDYPSPYNLDQELDPVAAATIWPVVYADDSVTIFDIAPNTPP